MPSYQSNASPFAGADLVQAQRFVWDSVNKLWVPTYAAMKRGDVATVAVGSIATILTPTSGKKFRLLGGMIALSAAASLLLEDNSAATANFICRIPSLVIATPFVFDLGPVGFLSAAADNVLKATSSAGANLTGTLFYTEE